MAFAIAVAAATGIVFGLAPALRLTRRRFAGPLLPGGRSVLRGQERFRAVLVVGQIALALVLLTGAGLMAKSFLRLRAVDTGFRTDNVVSLSLELPESVYPTPTATYVPPGVLAGFRTSGCRAAGSRELGAARRHASERRFQDRRRRRKPRFNVDKPAVGPGYFRAMGIRLLRGRDFNEDDTSRVSAWLSSVELSRKRSTHRKTSSERVRLWTRPGPRHGKPSWAS